jgi:hypothetical protein
MLSKLIVFGAGYVLGTKAGRDRYNQIAAIAREAARRLDGYAARNAVSARSSWSSSPTAGSRSVSSSRTAGSRSGSSSRTAGSRSRQSRF